MPHVSTDDTNAPVTKILVSRLLTRSGDQAWEFAVPVTLVSLFPSNLSLVAFIYLCSRLGSMVLQSWVASVIDRWERLKAVLVGISAQTVGMLVVTISMSLLFLQSTADLSTQGPAARFVLLAGVVFGSILSNLGASLMDIAVSNDWVPIVIPEKELARFNGRLRQVDLATEVGSPVVAGALLAMSSANGPLFGFLCVALWNIVSFIPEFLLLRTVFLNSPKLQRTITAIGPANPTSVIGQIKQGWHVFRLQPCYLTMVAYALLWLSVLSPHGVLLTGYLKGAWAMSEASLGILRGLGAVFGLASTLLFPVMRRKMGLVRTTQYFILLQAGVLLISIPYFVARTAEGWLFLGLVLLSRIGLYGFSLGEMELRQRTIPEGYRGTVNGVANSLTSLATLILFGIGTLITGQGSFQLLVLLSVGVVCTAAVIFVHWSNGAFAKVIS